MPKLLETFRDTDDMYRHLTGVICKYQGGWGLIHKTYSHFINWYPLDKCKELMSQKDAIKLNSMEVEASDFEFRNYSLGYFNTKDGKPIYLQRKSSQVQQESISTQNIKWPEKNYHEIYEYLADSGFLGMLTNRYPTLDDTWRTVAEKVPMKQSALAFENKLALKRLALSMVNVEYMGKNIGEMPIASTPSLVQLYPAYSHLKRYLLERGGLHCI